MDLNIGIGPRRVCVRRPEWASISEVTLYRNGVTAGRQRHVSHEFDET